MNVLGRHCQIHTDTEIEVFSLRCVFPKRHFTQRRRPRVHLSTLCITSNNNANTIHTHGGFYTDINNKDDVKVPGAKCLQL